MAKHRRTNRWIVGGILGLGGLCLFACLISAIYNATLPKQVADADQLSSADIAYILEARHLRQELGDQVWPGWSDAPIAEIVLNGQYIFLTGMTDPERGWVKVPDTRPRGGKWELLPEVQVGGMPVYRQPGEDADRQMGSFTVRVGQQWAWTLQSRQWSQVVFRADVSGNMPPVIAQVLPYSLAEALLFGGPERYVAGELHEAFHAYQGLQAPERLNTAERAAKLEEQYPWMEDASQDAWEEEAQLLWSAVKAADANQAREFARQFLEKRYQRRINTRMDPALIDYERQREWLEGLAKYCELSIGRQAANTPGYVPVAEMAALPDFHGYQPSADFYNLQIDEVRRVASYQEEVRFYYSGMAQAVLLDRLLPGWKERALQPNVYLEDLLYEAVQ